MRLTDNAIMKLEPPHRGPDGRTSQIITWDDDLPGFGLRTTSGGAKAFILNYRTGDAIQRRVTIGRYPSLTATAARLRARELKAKVELGEDPQGAKDARRGTLDLQAFVDAFVQRHLSRLRRGYETERILRTDAVPAIGPRRKANEIHRREIIQLVENKAQTAPIAANRLLGALRTLYNWGIERDLVENNPAAMVKRPTSERSRERVLTPTEIHAFWAGLETAPRMGDAVRDALKLILITAQRPGEVVAMEWEDLDLESCMWRLPSEKTKSLRSNRVPLPRTALELLATRKQQSRWVFESVRAKPVAVMALSRAVHHNREHFGLDRFTPHDLRRTAASQLASLESVDRFILGRILNHADREVTGIYDRHAYEVEKRKALEEWDLLLRQIVHDGPDVARS